MDMKKGISEKTWVILIVIVVIQILFDPLSAIVHLSENIQARFGLPFARNKWNSQKVTSYTFDVYMWSQNGPCTWTGNLEVKDEVVITAGKRSDWPGPYSIPYPELPSLESSTYTPFPCDYHNFTMLKLFDDLERQLQSHYPISQISFDSKYGFISSVQFGNPGEHGILSVVIVDCCNGFYIENFQVLQK